MAGGVAGEAGAEGAADRNDGGEKSRNRQGGTKGERGSGSQTSDEGASGVHREDRRGEGEGRQGAVEVGGGRRVHREGGILAMCAQGATGGGGRGEQHAGRHRGGAGVCRVSGALDMEPVARLRGKLGAGRRGSPAAPMAMQPFRMPTPTLQEERSHCPVPVYAISLSPQRPHMKNKERDPITNWYMSSTSMLRL